MMSSRFITTFPVLTELLSTGAALGCSDLATALTSLDLEVRLVGENGQAVPNVRVWLQDHKVDWDLFSDKRRHFVCTTDDAGYCSGEIRYWYCYQHFNRQKVEGGPTPPDRFELKIEKGNRLLSVGFLTPLESIQLHGIEGINFVGEAEM